MSMPKKRTKYYKADDSPSLYESLTEEKRAISTSLLAKRRKLREKMIRLERRMKQLQKRASYQAVHHSILRKMDVQKLEEKYKDAK